MDLSLEECLMRIRNGEFEYKSILISHYKPFILRTVNHVCKRRITWNDDEASIGLIAFNEAIDRFKAEYGKSFENYAFMMIRTRLIDEFRRKGKITRMELEWQNEDCEQSFAEVASSLAAFEQQEAAAILADELTSYDECLQQFGIRLEELEDVTPTHRDTRCVMMGIARMFCSRREWLQELLMKKQLPLKELAQEVQVSKKTLERNRKYLISLILIFGCDDFSRIRQTISFAELEGD